jgi:fluoride exporter
MTPAAWKHVVGAMDNATRREGGFFAALLPCAETVWNAYARVRKMQNMIHAMIWVALGGVLGGPARYFVSGVVGRHIGETFPWGTLVVNVSGSLVAGVFAAAAIAGLLTTSTAWLFAVTGFLGCYTTVSSFGIQTLALARDGQMAQAGGYVLLSVTLCLTAVTLGYAAGSAILGIGLS